MSIEAHNLIFNSSKFKAPKRMNAAVLATENSIFNNRTLA